MQTSKEPCPICDRYAMVDTKTTKITCKVTCVGNGMTRAEAKATRKQWKESAPKSTGNTDRGKVIDPWAN